jgi:hypothetical protein
MKLRLLAFVLACAVGAFAQHGGSGGGGGGMGHGSAGAGGVGAGSMGAGTGSDMGSSRSGVSTGRNDASADHGRNSGAGANSGTQQPLKDSQIESGAFRKLEKDTGMTSAELQKLYASSGAKNFGQFAAAIIVSKNLNLDSSKVLAGLKTMSLGETLQSLGVSKKDAKNAIKEAEKDVDEAEKG